LGKKTRIMLETWGMKDNTKAVRHRRRGCMYTHIDKKEYIGVTTHTHCIIMMNTLVIMYWRWEAEKKSTFAHFDFNCTVMWIVIFNDYNNIEQAVLSSLSSYYFIIVIVAITHFSSV
jgi:hypothetical protein